MPRYHVAPIADPDCTAINTNVVICETDNLADAAYEARHAGHQFGAAILDTKTKKIDWGYGFGVPVPELPAA